MGEILFYPGHADRYVRHSLSALPQRIHVRVYRLLHTFPAVFCREFHILSRKPQTPARRIRTLDYQPGEQIVKKEKEYRSASGIGDTKSENQRAEALEEKRPRRLWQQHEVARGLGNDAGGHFSSYSYSFFSAGLFIVREIRFLAVSTPNTQTVTISPTFTASDGWRINRLLICEMWTNPS